MSDDRASGESRGDVLVGLMSGTAADGISAAAVRFGAGGDHPVATLLAYCEQPYASAQRERLLRALDGASLSTLALLDFELGAWLADAALAAIASAGLAPREVRAIASHGHTIWHEAPLATWQIGQSAVIAERTGVDVVSDFRVRDVAAGGQGAPLVAVADRALFAAEGAWRALQNIGGIGNVSVVPPRGVDAPVVAFDTGPGVAIIDGVVRTLLPGLAYDVDGVLARRGSAIESVVRDALAEPYFASPPPKSTGRELFDRSYIARFIARCRAASASATAEDIVATAVSFTARSIADAYRRFITAPVADVVISGGGARNPALVSALIAAVAPLPVRMFDTVFFNGDAKEAVAFAFLGRLFLERRAGNLPAATGARGPRILGKLTPA
ncbi:MAG TPA: anhydro-N-acetylmuramic acid kinase [Gemmatimonadaceae bacterium]|nr:anhydro-N-acetylmuramic acid kinase [Gemmatimonadaceae bacterium]